MSKPAARKDKAVASVGQLLIFVERALDGIDALPVRQRIDLHQAAAAVLENVDPKAADTQAAIAHLLREAQRHQLQFRELLK